jgi:predicted naringenin-chalcone synthase
MALKEETATPIEDLIQNAVNDLVRNYPDTRRQQAETIVRRFAHQIEERIKSEILSSLRTVDDVASRYQITPRRVRAIVQALHERGERVGYQLPGTSQWLFLPEEVELLEPGPPGRPSKS